MTDTTRWARVEEIFHDVVDLAPGPDRETHLARLCGGDETLAADVLALLSEDARLLDGTTAVPDPHLGLRLGTYAVDALIARGGMAAVYAAHRADDQFQQRVAIKIMDLRLSDPALVAQFRAERQILAALEHPALTRLLDGGVTALGEPYLVMEYIDGQPIDRYCDERRLDLDARLQLFRQVCDGVAFAHRNLVLHRDLKPSNILVSAGGHVKVVDFGTATLLQPDRVSTITPAPLTPAYASPEQLTGQPVGTGSDQYSLGLVLYELLTGAPAFGERTSLMASVERAMAGTEPITSHTTVSAEAAAARQVSPSRLKRQLSGDLGTIVRKTLAAEPTRRYESVQHLADDLVRWSAGEPILARVPSFTYQTSRFVQRHWAAVAIAATLLMALIGATIVSLQQAARATAQAEVARSESARAVTESTKARQLNRFLTQMLSSADPWSNAATARAGTITVREVLDGASAVVSKELGATPAVEAEMRRTIGSAYVALGAVDAADAQLESALALYRRIGDEQEAATTRTLMGNSLIWRGAFVDAEAMLREALAYVRSPAGGEHHALAVTTRQFLALSLTYQRPGDREALDLYREAIAIADEFNVDRAVASAIVQSLGMQLVIAGQLSEAEARLRDALRRVDELSLNHPSRPPVLRSLSELMRTVGNYPEAARFGSAATQAAIETIPADHPFVPAIKTTWGRALVETGDLAQAELVLDEAYTAFKKLRPAGHTDLAVTQLGLGTLYRHQGRLRDSEQILRQARASLRSNPSIKAMHAGVAGELGLTLLARGDRAGADALLRESYTVFASYLSDSHPYVTRAKARREGAAQ